MSTQTQNLQLIKPDKDEYYDIQVQNSNMDKIDTSIHSLSTNVEEHLGNKNNPHNVTKSQIGLGSVPNVTTNDQTPTYTPASANTALASGEKLSIAFGKISKAISSLITHLADTVGHITSAERSKWNGKLDATAKATDSDKLDGSHASDFMKVSGGDVTGVVNYTNSTWGLSIKKPGFSKGDMPSETTYWALNMMDENAGTHTNRVGLLQTFVDTTGATVTQIHAMKNAASSTDTSIISVHYLKDGTKYAQAPTPASATDSSTKIATTEWVNGYALAKGGTATRATSDASGNNIASTYRKKADGSIVKIQASAPTDTTSLWVW